MILIKALDALPGKGRRSKLLFVFIFLVHSGSTAQKVSVEGENLQPDSIFRIIYRQIGYDCKYTEDIFRDWPAIRLSVRDVPLTTFLQRCFAGMNYSWKIDHKVIYVWRKPSNGPLYRTLRGRVLNDDNEGLSQAILSASDRSGPVHTREDGSFVMAVEGFDTYVTISCPGYDTLNLLLSNKYYHDRDIVLSQRKGNLERVVVLAYGRPLRKHVTGSDYTIRNKDIANQPVLNVMDVLQWQTPGLFIQRETGIFGSAFKTISRGRHSISAGNEPRVVINGIFMPDSTLNGIAPENIEKITVLNGAAATAVYGSRGANGVILVELKKGLPGKLQLMADVSFGPVISGKASPLLNTQQYLQLRRTAVLNDGLPADTSTIPELKLDTTRYTDLRKVVLGKTGVATNAHVAVTGGTANSYFLLSGTLHDQSTVFPGPTEDARRSLYENLHVSSRDDRLITTISVLYSWQKISLPQEDLTRYMVLAPNAPSFIDPLIHNRYRVTSTNFLGHMGSSYRFSKHLTAEGKLGLYRTATINDEAVTRFKSMAGEGLVRYRSTIGKGILEVVGGGTLQREWRDSLGDRVSYYYAAVFAQGTYTLKDRYVLTASGRRDGSSRWSQGNRYGNFGSIGGAWIFKEEDLLKNWKGLSFGKIRGDWGIVGNDQIANFQFSQLYTSISGGSGRQGFIPSSLYNPSLKWEVYVNKEIGLDLGFLKNKLLFSVLAYQSYSKNQLIKTNTPGQTGEPGILASLPIRVQNDGLEFGLRSDLGRQSGWLWESMINVTIPRNRLMRYPGLENSLYANSFVVKQSLSVSKGYHFTHVDADSGLYRFQDLNGDGVLDRQDYVNIPSRDPKIYGAWSNRLTRGPWQLDLTVGFTFWNGINPLIALDMQDLPGAGAEGPSLLGNGPVEWLRGRWYKPGDHARLQRLTAMPGSRAQETLLLLNGSDAVITDASFCRLKTMSLSWRLPEKWLKRLCFQNMQLYVRGHDLFTITSYPVADPETQNYSVMPITRSFQIGFSITR